MDCRDEDNEAHGHSHGHDHNHDGHDHDHVPPPDTNAVQSLYRHIDHDGIVTLNETDAGSGAGVFKDWDRRLNVSEFVESDVDEQLLITVPFTGVVRLHSLLVRSVADERAPDRIRVFKNRQDLDFNTAADMKPTAEFRHPAGVGADDDDEGEPGTLDSEGIVEYAFNRAHFSNVTALTLFVQDNHGAETTKITYIGLRGQFQSPLGRAPVVTLYEAAANPRDHKNVVPGERYVSEAP